MEPGQTHAQTNELSPSRCQSPGFTSTAFQAGSAPSTPTPYTDPDGMSQGSWCEVAPSLTHTRTHTSSAWHLTSLLHSPMCATGSPGVATLSAQASSASHPIISRVVSATHIHAEHHMAVPW